MKGLFNSLQRFSQLLFGSIAICAAMLRQLRQFWLTIPFGWKMPSLTDRMALLAVEIHELGKQQSDTLLRFAFPISRQLQPHTLSRF